MIAKAISKDLQKTIKFKSFSLLYSLFECIFARKYHKMRQKAVTRVTRELDIETVMNRLRLATFVSLGILNSSQSHLVETMTPIIVRESSDPDDET